MDARLANLRYSPVNWLIVDWSFNGQAFSDCSLPSPSPCDETEETAAPCRAIPIQEAIDTYDWARWLPEVIVGIDEPNEEIAANYVRLAANQFAKGARVLQRELTVQLQPGIQVYPVYPYEGEVIEGVIAAKLNGRVCGCNERMEGVEWQFDTARNELYIHGNLRGEVKVLVYSAPALDSCYADKFLYDHFQFEIQLGARFMYALANHYRDRALMASIPNADTFARAILMSKTKAMRGSSSSQMRPSTAFGRCSVATNGDARYNRRRR